MKSPVCLSGPRPPRPRWRSQGRRRSTTQRSRPQRSGGRRQGGFLVSRGMRDPGSPRDLSRGVVPQGKKVAGRRCGKGDRGAAVLRLDQARRGRVGRSPPDRPGDSVTPRTLHSLGHPGLVAQRPSAAHDRRPTGKGCAKPNCGVFHLVQVVAARRHGQVQRLGQRQPALSSPNASAGLDLRPVSTGSPAAPASDHARAPRDPERGVVAPFCVRDRARKGRNGDSRFERSRRARPRRVTPALLPTGLAQPPDYPMKAASTAPPRDAEGPAKRPSRRVRAPPSDDRGSARPRAPVRWSGA